MKHFAAIFLLICLTFLSACGTQGAAVPTQTPVASAPPPTEQVSEPIDASPIPETEPAEESEPPKEQAPVPTEPVGKDAVYQQFFEAMSALTPEVALDTSGMTWEYGAETDLKNIYYSILSEHEDLKYTYDMTVSASGETAVCTFFYMPYKTGTYDNGLPAGSHTVSSLHAAVVMAQSMIDGTERLPIAITDASLSVDDLQRALAQAGYGWFYYSLNQDGTEIVSNIPVGKTLDECVQAINDSFQLGADILSETITKDMTDLEKAKALYDHIVQTVAYDFRYYSDRENMPYESTVALGALRDQLAICGGYAQAFKTLLDMAGIENYTVSGVAHNENHMWNYVILDGQGFYCDPTADRGGMEKHFMLTGEELNARGEYTWDTQILSKISGLS